MVKSQVIYKDYSKDAERTALVSGENLAHMFGKIARWYTDISWVGHTHTEANITDFGTYAGASTKGGAATSANKLNIGSTDIGSETKPVYFNATTGKPVACAYSLNASVPANAVFTDINVKQSPSTANESREVLFAGNTGNTETTGTVGKSNKLYFNPNTGSLTATSFSGSIDASNLTGSIDAGRLPTTSVTAGSYGPAAGGTLAHGGTFDVGYVTVDKYGRLTGASTKTFTLPAQYVHPTYTSKTSGLYKITVDGTGHVSGTAAVTAADLPAHTHSDYLPLAGGTMTGAITLPKDKYRTDECGLDCNNSNIINANNIKFGDAPDADGSEGIHYYRSATTWDSLWSKDGVLYFTPNFPTGTTHYTIYHSGNLTYSTIGAAPTSHTHQYAKSSSVNGPAYSVEGSQGTTNADRHIWFSFDNDETRRAYSDNFKYNPATNIITVGAVGISPSFAVQTGSSKAAHITFETLITWLTDTKKAVPKSYPVHKIIRTTWAYADNDILQITADGTNYEIQLAGSVIEIHGTIVTYNTGEWRMKIYTAPAVNGFTPTTGYTKAPVSSIFTYTCNGSGYNPTWRLLSYSNHTHNYIPNTQAGLIAAINLLQDATATPTDDCYYITQDNAAANNNYYRRKHSALWAYVNGKISGTTSGSGNAVTSISYANGVITATKGSTFSLSNHTHSNYLSTSTKYAISDSVGGVAVSSYSNHLRFNNEMNISKLSASGHVWVGYRWDTDGTTELGRDVDIYITRYKFGNADGALAEVEASAFIGNATSATTATTATTASKLGTNAGNNISPVYFSGGVPVACKQVASGAFFSVVPFVRSDGVMDIGRYIDFHTTNTATSIGYRMNQYQAGKIEFNSYTTNNVLNMYTPSGYNQIKFQTGETDKASNVAGIIVRPLTTSGALMQIECSGNMVIGSGESPSTLYSNSYDNLDTSETERLYLASDNEIYFITNAQTYAGVKRLIIDKSGNLKIQQDQHVIQLQNSTSNYTSAIKWWKSGTDPGNYGPEIGQHNVGDTDGSICILPYNTSTSPWGGSVGLFISKTRLLYNGTAISLNGHTHSYLPLSGGTLTGYLKLGASDTETLPNCGITIHDIRSVNVPAAGFGSGKLVNFYFHCTDTPNSEWWSIIHMKGWTGAYCAWELAGTAHNGDGRSRPLYVRTSNENTAWGSWRKIYDSSNKPTLSELGAASSSHTHTYLIDPAESTYKIEVAWRGESVPTTATSYPAVYTTHNKSSDVTYRIKEMTWSNFGTMLGLKSAAFTESSAYATASHNHDSSYVAKSMIDVSTTANLGLDGGKNAFGYVSGLTKAAWNNNQTDGIIIRQFYNASWKTELFIDYRTGQTSVRGKNNGTFTDWGSFAILKSDGNYWGICSPSGANNVWIRTTTLGIIPYQSGAAGSGHCGLGTSSWYFSYAYIDDIYGTLHGNASTASEVGTVVTDPSSNTAYGITFVVDPGTSENNTIRKTNCFRLNHSVGAANTEGITEIVLGNSVAKTAANNSSGQIAFYNSNGKYAVIKPNTNSSNVTLYLPSSGGTLALVGDNNHTHSQYLSSSTVYAKGVTQNGDAVTAQSLRVTHGNEINASKPGDYTYIWFFYRWNDGGTEDTSGSKYISTIYFGNGNGAGTNTSVGRFADLQFNNIAAGTLRHTGANASWWNDRNAAMLYQSYGDSNYRPTWGTATKDDGSWCCGNHSNNNLTFNYIPYSVYNSGQNPTLYKQIIFTDEAKIEARGYNVINNGSGRLVMDYSGIVLTNSKTGTWAAGIDMKNASGTLLSAIGFYGSDTALTYTYLGGAYNDPIIKLESSGYATFKDGMKVNNNISLQETKNIILRPNHSSYTAGIGYDTSGNECIAIWAKNTVTRLRWHAGTDMTTMTSGTMMGITPDFEISKASGTAKGYIAGDSIVTHKILWSGSTSCTARSSTSITLTTAISANKYRFIKVVWNCGTYTGTSEFRGDTLNTTNNVPTGSDATTTNIIQFKISSDGKSITVGPGTAAITMLQVAGVCVI